MKLGTLRRPLIVFLVCFAVVAGISVLVASWGKASGDLHNCDEFFGGGWRTLLAWSGLVAVEGLVLAIVSVMRPRRLAPWLAGYAGVVVGSVPFAILYGDSCYGWSATTIALYMRLLEVVAPAASPIVVAPVAGLIFLVVGAAAYIGRHEQDGGDAGPPTPTDEELAEQLAAARRDRAEPHSPTDRSPDAGLRRRGQ